jgi:hypothetical protein
MACCHHHRSSARRSARLFTGHRSHAHWYAHALAFVCSRIRIHWVSSVATMGVTDKQWVQSTILEGGSTCAALC